MFPEKHFACAKHWICWLTSAKTHSIKSLFRWFFDLCHYISESLNVMGKITFIFVFSRRKSNSLLKIYSRDFFMQANVIKPKLIKNLNIDFSGLVQSIWSWILNGRATTKKWIVSWTFNRMHQFIDLWLLKTGATDQYS